MLDLVCDDKDPRASWPSCMPSEKGMRMRHWEGGNRSAQPAPRGTCSHRPPRLWSQGAVCWLFLILLTPADQSLVVVNEGNNVTLSCDDGPGTSGWRGGAGSETVWVLPHRANISGTLVLQDTGDLLIMRADPAAAGRYTCTAGSAAVGDAEPGVMVVELLVRSRPDRLVNLTVTPHAVYATVSWSVASSMSSSPGLVPDGFFCQYRQDLGQEGEEEVAQLLNSSTQLGPDSRTCDLYDLKPFSTYYVQVAAYNELGVGEFVSSLFTTSNLSQPCDYHPTSATSAIFFFLPEYGRLVGIAVSVCILVGALVATLLLLIVFYHRKKLARTPSPLHEELPDDEECLELVPHITLNPSFNIEMLEHISPDYNDTSEHTFLVTGISSSSTGGASISPQR